MKNYYYILSLLFVVGCTTTQPIMLSTGSSSEQLLEASTSHAEVATKISDDAKSIVSTSKEEDTVKTATDIVLSAGELNQYTQLLKAESKTKNDLMGTVADLSKEITHLNEELKSEERKKYQFLRLGGMILFAAGIAACFYLKNLSLLAASLFGALLIGSTFIVRFFEQYGDWLMWGLIVSGIWFAVKTFLLQDKTVEASVKVGEMVKKELRERAPEAVKELFGDDMKPGVIQQPKDVQRLITAKRKCIQKTAKSIYTKPNS